MGGVLVGSEGSGSHGISGSGSESSHGVDDFRGGHNTTVGGSSGIMGRDLLVGCVTGAGGRRGGL